MLKLFMLEKELSIHNFIHLAQVPNKRTCLHLIQNIFIINGERLRSEKKHFNESKPNSSIWSVDIKLQA